MKSYIILNDLHLSESTEETVFNILSYAASEAKKTNCCVAILGDFYDTVYKDGLIDARLQKRVYNFFSKHFTKDTLYLLSGNHDIYNGYRESALSVFEAVATVHENVFFDVKEKLLWLPYRDGGYTEAEISSWRRQGAKTCFSHNDFKYLNTRRNFLSRDGMEPSIFDGIQVFNGHYHYPNQEQNVICVGSQYAVHKTESFDQKRLYTVTVSEYDKHTWSSTPIRFGRREFVYPMDYAQDLYESYWLKYVKIDKRKGVPPPTFPTIQDTLVIEYEESTFVEPSWCENIDCPVVFRQQVKENIVKNTDHITFDTSVSENIIEAVNELYTASPDSLKLSLEEISGKILAEFKEFNKEHNGTFYSKDKKTLTFTHIEIHNFCGINQTDIKYDDSITKIKGQNGIGKTIQYPTAFLYGMTGVLDGRFTEERMLLTDIRTNKMIDCKVSVYGKLNNTPFSIIRSYDGKKTNLKFVFDNKSVVFPTIKKKQKNICLKLFNAHVGSNACPHRFLHKLLLQRIVWKQGGRESDLLRMNSEAFKTVCLETVNKGDYNAFLKYLKMKISGKKKHLESHKNTLLKLGIIVEERTKISNNENLMLNAWCDYRRNTLEECKARLKKLQNVSVSRDNVDDFINHTVSIKTLQNRINDLLSSKEGIRWNPEYTLNKLEEAHSEMELSNSSLKMLQEEIDHYVRCMETFKYIENIFYKRICKVLEKFDCNVNLFSAKKLLVDGQPMKYLSGGEYEQESLKLFTSFQNFVKFYAYWDCNLTIFDEPGTAMSTELLQSFVNTLSKTKCNLVITHKPIKCPIEVYLN